MLGGWRCWVGGVGGGGWVCVGMYRDMGRRRYYVSLRVAAGELCLGLAIGVMDNGKEVVA